MQFGLMLGKSLLPASDHDCQIPSGWLFVINPIEGRESPKIAFQFIGGDNTVGYLCVLFILCASAA